MKIVNRIVKMMPPITLNINAKPNKIKAMPKYIGFLEYSKTPEVTKEEAFSIFIGLTVVLCFLKEFTADIRIHSPIKKNV
jgi:hypothetical protein